MCVFVFLLDILTILPNPNLKKKAGIILFFYCQQIPRKNSSHQLVCPSLNTLWFLYAVCDARPQHQDSYRRCKSQKKLTNLQLTKETCHEVLQVAVSGAFNHIALFIIYIFLSTLRILGDLKFILETGNSNSKQQFWSFRS